MFTFTLIRSSLVVILASLTFLPATPQLTELAFFTPVQSNNKPVEFLSFHVRPMASPDALATTSTYYTVRRDMRRCASPLCGGYFIRRVNQSATRCVNGRYLPECYVVSIDWNGQPEVEINKAVLRGSLISQGNRNGKYAVLHVTEAWSSASDKPAAGIFYRVRDLGVRCIAAPCRTHYEAKLNTTISQNIAGVDLSEASTEQNLTSDAFQAMTGPGGILVAGSHVPVKGPAGPAEQLRATQFYLQTKQTAQKPCIKTGCSGQICAEETVVSTCEWRQEYECYKKARCERQTDGNCGFSKTPELTACLGRK